MFIGIKRLRGSIGYGGFTILEVLLAVGISSLALVMAYSAFRIGWFSYRKLENQSQVYLNLRSAFNRIAKDTRNSFLFKTKDNDGIFFEGKEKEMSFVTLMRSKDEEGKDCVNVVKVFYKFENNNLLRAYLKNTDILKTDLEIKYDVFLTNITELKFDYAAERNESSEFEWKNVFDAKDALPLAVRIKLIQKFDMLPAISFTKSIALSY